MMDYCTSYGFICLLVSFSKIGIDSSGIAGSGKYNGCQHLALLRMIPLMARLDCMILLMTDDEQYFEVVMASI
jgi:hypothetical protein